MFKPFDTSEEVFSEHTFWCVGCAMGYIFEKYNFQIVELSTGNTTIYVVTPNFLYFHIVKKDEI